LRLLDVGGPLVVIVDRVDAEADHLDVALVEFGLELGHRAQLGGADRGEVPGVGEEHAPGVAEPLVEADASGGGVGFEVGGAAAESRLRPVTLTLRLSKSGLSSATAPSSVVQTGVKSLGWEKSTPQLSPSHSWKRIGPSVVSASKSGAVSLIVSAILASIGSMFFCFLRHPKACRPKAGAVSEADLSRLRSSARLLLTKGWQEGYATVSFQQKEDP